MRIAGRFLFDSGDHLTFETKYGYFEIDDIEMARCIKKLVTTGMLDIETSYLVNKLLESK